MLPQSTNTSNLNRFVNERTVNVANIVSVRFAFTTYEFCQSTFHYIITSKIWNQRCQMELANSVRSRCRLSHTHKRSIPTPLWFTNANEVGRNILRVRPRGCGRGSRMLCCHGNHVQGCLYTYPVGVRVRGGVPQCVYRTRAHPTLAVLVQFQITAN